MKRFAVIVAGGKGKRFGGQTPKQFRNVCGLPVIMHTIEAFAAQGCKVILVLPKDQFDYWNQLCEMYEFEYQVNLVEGGKERFHSVKNGVNSIADPGCVAVHDGVRPLVTKKMIEKGFVLAENRGSAIPVVSVRDSMRIASESGYHSVNREDYKMVQTPQVFDLKNLQEVMDCDYEKNFTDEATLWENKGKSLYFFEGDHQNIKITYPSDLTYAEAVFSED
jgi:2-C-methyl-D-erythritol 4-phosphate cytidylyltransferase